MPNLQEFVKCIIAHALLHSTNVPLTILLNWAQKYETKLAAGLDQATTPDAHALLGHSPSEGVAPSKTSLQMVMWTKQQPPHLFIVSDHYYPKRRLAQLKMGGRSKKSTPYKTIELDAISNESRWTNPTYLWLTHITHITHIAHILSPWHEGPKTNSSAKLSFPRIPLALHPLLYP